MVRLPFMTQELRSWFLCDGLNMSHGRGVCAMHRNLACGSSVLVTQEPRSRFPSDYVNMRHDRGFCGAHNTGTMIVFLVPSNHQGVWSVVLV